MSWLPHSVMCTLARARRQINLLLIFALSTLSFVYLSTDSRNECYSLNAHSFVCVRTRVCKPSSCGTLPRAGGIHVVGGRSSLQRCCRRRMHRQCSLHVLAVSLYFVLIPRFHVSDIDHSRRPSLSSCTQTMLAVASCGVLQQAVCRMRCVAF